jgi:hypothetical protein
VIIDPVIGFILVWLLAGSLFAIIVQWAGLKSMSAVGACYLLAVGPALWTALILAR